MTTFSIASILGDQRVKHEDNTNSKEDQEQLILKNSVQDLYDALYKTAAVAAHLNDQHHQHRNNLLGSFPLTNKCSPTADYYSIHKINPQGYPGNLMEH